MQKRERFLSVLLGPHHLRDGRIRHRVNRDGAIVDLPRPMALVLEYIDERWTMYYLNADKKIQAYWFAESLEDGYIRARHEFGINADEWVEDFSE